MELYNHQKEILDLNPNRYLLAHDTGAGKTLTSLELAKKKEEPTLIIVPKALKEKWQREADEHMSDHVTFVMTKEEFRKDWDNIHYFPTVIVDEAHFFSNYKSQMSKALWKYFKKHNIPYRYLLTATPYLSTPMNIYTLARLLGKDYGYMYFVRRFFNAVWIGQQKIMKPKAGIEEELNLLIKEIGSTNKLEDNFDVPEQYHWDTYVDLTKEQEKAIANITDPEHIVYWTKRHQIENGCLKGDEYTESQSFKNNKEEIIKDICEKNKKVAIVCRYHVQMQVIKDILKDTKNVVEISGKVKDRDGVVSYIEKTEEVVVLIQSSCSEGYELPSIAHIVFTSMDFSYKNYKQMMGRFLRANKLKTNYFYYILVEKGVDNDVYKNVMNKQDFSFALYE